MIARDIFRIRFTVWYASVAFEQSRSELRLAFSPSKVAPKGLARFLVEASTRP